MSLYLFQLHNCRNIKEFRKLYSKFLLKKTGRRCCSKYFITTPIFYVNAEPHIGHLYTSVIADAANRFQKLMNPSLKTKFMVGTDEHGTKVCQSADALNVDVKLFCDEISQKYKKMFELFSIEYDDFVRTTEKRHIKAATALWNKIYSKNLIYKSSYSGWYCVADEMFVTEKHLDKTLEKNGVRFTLEGKPVEFFEEENYSFKLSSLHNDLQHWLKGDIVKPKLFQTQLLNYLDEFQSKDISISRPAKRVSWGIPVPGDPSQTIYVWMDALSSYLCSNGYPESNFKWPPDVQVFGKDILRFHGIFWPAFLMAADLEPPKQLYCHSHWLRDNKKMSKSFGNVLNPFECVNKYTSDGLRYFLLKGGVPHNDGNFSDTKATQCLNADLGDSLGNLLSRCSGKTINPSQIFPSLMESNSECIDENCEGLINIFEKLPDKVIDSFNDLNFEKGITFIIEALHRTNGFFQIRKPWDKSNNVKYNTVTLHFTMEALRVCGILLQPIIPKISKQLLNKLSVPVNNRNITDIRPYSWEFTDRSATKNVNIATNSVILFCKIKI